MVIGEDLTLQFQRGSVIKQEFNSIQFNFICRAHKYSTLSRGALQTVREASMRIRGKEKLPRFVNNLLCRKKPWADPRLMDSAYLPGA